MYYQCNTFIVVLRVQYVNVLSYRITRRKNYDLLTRGTLIHVHKIPVRGAILYKTPFRYNRVVQYIHMHVRRYLRLFNLPLYGALPLTPSRGGKSDEQIA